MTMHIGRYSSPLMPDLDYVLVTMAGGLFAFGLVMVGSATMHMDPNSPFGYINRQLIALAIALLVSWPVFHISMRWWEHRGWLTFLLGLTLLTLVLIPGVGVSKGGATRWINLGPFNLQSSEYMKLFVVIYLAGYLVRRGNILAGSFWAFLTPMSLLGVAGLLLILEPDFGATAVIVAIALGMLFLGGVPLTPFVAMGGAVAAALVGLIWYAPYRLQRVTSFLDPWDDPSGSDFQLSGSLIALGRGEWTGVGLGAGLQKLFHLPEIHTDFVIAVVGEELGLLGTLSVMAMLAILVWRAFAIGVEAERRGKSFGGWLAQGIGLWIAVQSLISVGVNVGFLPTKGLTLPFMSYGGSSVIVFCLAVTLLLRVDYDNRRTPLLAAEQSARRARKKAKKAEAKAESEGVIPAEPFGEERESLDDGDSELVAPSSPSPAGAAI